MANKTSGTKQMRSIGHSLRPVVTIAQKGFTASIRNEINRALDDHELIKVKIKAGSRDSLQSITEDICNQCPAELIQAIGHIALIYRPAEKPNPRLSNLLR